MLPRTGTAQAPPHVHPQVSQLAWGLRAGPDADNRAVEEPSWIRQRPASAVDDVIVRRAVTASIIGNGLEWYDFLI